MILSLKIGVTFNALLCTRAKQLNMMFAITVFALSVTELHLILQSKTKNRIAKYNLARDAQIAMNLNNEECIDELSTQMAFHDNVHMWQMLRYYEKPLENPESILSWILYDAHELSLFLSSFRISECSQFIEKILEYSIASYELQQWQNIYSISQFEAIDSKLINLVQSIVSIDLNLSWNRNELHGWIDESWKSYHQDVCVAKFLKFIDSADLVHLYELLDLQCKTDVIIAWTKNRGEYALIDLLHNLSVTLIEN